MLLLGKSKADGRQIKAASLREVPPASEAPPVEKMTAESMKITSLIAKGAQVIGALVLTSGVKIDGEVRGNIDIADNGTVYVSESAFVEGNVHAPKIIIAGRIAGSVRGDNVCVYASARVEGDIEYQVLKVADGATINGCVSCKNPIVDVSNENGGGVDDRR